MQNRAGLTVSRIIYPLPARNVFFVLRPDEKLENISCTNRICALAEEVRNAFYRLAERHPVSRSNQFLDRQCCRIPI